MNQIIDKKFFSSTDLKNKTKNVLDTTESLGEVFIMNNNKPKAVIISIKQYNALNNNFIPCDNPDKWEKESIENHIKNSNNEDGSDAKSFLNNLIKN